MLLEQRLMILGARISLDDSSASEIELILKLKPNWNRVLSDSEPLGVKPMLYKHLSESRFVGFVPDWVLANFKAHFRMETFRAMKRYAEIQEILERMNRDHIQVVLLKGAFLAHWIYKDIALRPMNDIDILCRVDDQDAVCRNLTEMGYEQLGDQLQSVFVENLKEHLTPFYKHDKSRVEVHRHIFPKMFFDFEIMKQMCPSLIPVNLNGAQAFALSPEDHLLLLCVHLFGHLVKHAEIVLYWFSDIDLLIRHYEPGIDWNKFSFGAKAAGVLQEACAVLALMKREWHSPVPGSIFRHLSGTPLYLTLESRFDNTFSLQYYIRLLQDIWKIKRFKNRIYVLLSFIFPSRLHLVSRYERQKTEASWRLYLVHFVNVLKNAKKRLSNLPHTL